MAKKSEANIEKSNYRLLAEHIDKLYGLPPKYTEDHPMVKYFKIIMTDEQAALALQIGKELKPAEVIGFEIGRNDYEELEKELWDLSVLGVLYCEFTTKGKAFYKLPPWFPGIMEYMVVNMGKYDGVAECFNEHASNQGPKGILMNPNSGGMRVVPVMKEIAAQQKALSYEEVLGYLDQKFYAPDDINHEHPMEPLYSLADCACRTSKHLIGEGCDHTIKDMCIQIGPEAEYYIRTGKGRKATREEVMEVLNKAEDEGLVHEVFEFGQAYHPIGESTFICNCCGCCCGAISGNNKFGALGMATHSSYVSRVDPEKCVACGACVEKCPTNAIRLGDRLCKDADGQVDIYETGYDYEWGEDKWNLDYRDRIMTTGYGTSPCKTTCPAHIAVQGYIRKAAEGDYKGALEVIKRENPFPAVCGRVCPHPCETECSRSTVDEAVAIDEIKRFIAEQDMDSETRFIPEIKEHYDEKIAVVGAGPSGLTCAYYLAAKGFPVTVFEKSEDVGGMMIKGIPSFRLDKDIVHAEIDIIRQMGVEFRTGVEVGKDVTIQQLRDQGYKAFYVAIGLQAGGRLGIPGDDAKGVMSGIEYSIKTNFEGTQKLSGKCVIIGGGNIGADVARTAVRSGASEVHLFCLEGYDEMPMGYGDRTECEAEGIIIHAGWGQTEIIKDGDKCAGIRFRKCLSVRNAEGRFAPKFDDNDTMEIDCSTVLYCIGNKADWGKMLEGTKVRLNPNGTAIADPVTRQTDEPDIFVGGDAFTGQKFVIDAIAGGKQGYESVWRYAEGRNLTYNRKREYHEIDKEQLKHQFIKSVPRQVPAKDGEVHLTFEDTSKGLTEEQVRKEVDRCLGCGRAIVDPKKCIGCGVCTVQCKFDAAHLEFEHERKPAKSTTDWKIQMVKYIAARKVRVSVNEAAKKVGLDPVSRAIKARERAKER